MEVYQGTIKGMVDWFAVSNLSHTEAVGIMMSDGSRRHPPSTRALTGFAGGQSAYPLVGGMGMAWCVGNIVLKPSPNAAQARCLAETHIGLPEVSGCRFQRPIPDQYRSAGGKSTAGSPGGFRRKFLKWSQIWLSLDAVMQRAQQIVERQNGLLFGIDPSGSYGPPQFHPM
jgi:hypothetical protein